MINPKSLADVMLDWVQDNKITSEDLLRQTSTLMMGLAQQYIDADAEEKQAIGEIHFTLPSETNYITEMVVKTYYYDKERLN